MKTMARQYARATTGRGQLYDSVVDTIGNTPCVKINNLAPDGVNLYVKAEFFNPAGSVKDRLAISIIEEAEKRGDLKPGQTVVGRQAATQELAWLWFVRLRATPLSSLWPIAFRSSGGS